MHGVHYVAGTGEISVQDAGSGGRCREDQTRE